MIATLKPDNEVIAQSFNANIEESKSSKREKLYSRSARHLVKNTVKSTSGMPEGASTLLSLNQAINASPGDANMDQIWSTYSKKSQEKLLSSTNLEQDLIGINKSRLRKMKDIVDVNYIYSLRPKGHLINLKNKKQREFSKKVNLSTSDPEHQISVKKAQKKAKEEQRRELLKQKDDRLRNRRVQRGLDYHLAQSDALFKAQKEKENEIHEVKVNYRRIAQRANRQKRAQERQERNLEKEEKKEYSLNRLEQKRMRKKPTVKITVESLFDNFAYQQWFWGAPDGSRYSSCYSRVPALGYTCDTEFGMNYDPNELYALVKDFFNETYAASSRGIYHLIRYTSQYTHWVVFLFQLSRATNKWDYLAAAHQFIQILAIKEKRIVTLVINFATMFQYHVYPESGLDDLPLAKQFLSFLKRVLHSDIVRVGRELIVNIISYQIFEKDMTTTIRNLFGYARKMPVLDFIELVLTNVEKLVDIGDLLIQGVPWSEALFAPDPCMSLNEEMRALLYYADKLYIGIHVEGQKSCREFIVESDKLITTGEGVIKVSNPLHPGTIELKKLLLQIKNSRFAAENLMNSTSRVMPLGVIIHGDPGIGKSKIMNFVADIWSNVMGRQFDSSHIYHRVVTSDYWEGYQPFSQPIIHYSELGNEEKKLVASKGDKPTAEVNSLMDTQAYSCDMAFGEKGKVFAHPELILIDTNCPDMNLDVLYKNSAAMKRRFIYIEPRVKSEYRIAGSPSLDVRKSLLSEEPEMDRWIFTVYKEIPVNLKDTRSHVLLADGDIYDLVDTLKNLFKHHAAEQQSIVDNDKELHNSAKYDRGNIHVESGIVDLSTVYSGTDLMSTLKPYVNYSQEIAVTGLWLIVYYFLLSLIYVFKPRTLSEFFKKVNALCIFLFSLLMVASESIQYRFVFFVITTIFILLGIQSSIFSVNLPMKIIDRAFYPFFYKWKVLTQFNVSVKKGYSFLSSHRNKIIASITLLGLIRTVYNVMFPQDGSLPKKKFSIYTEDSSNFYMRSTNSEELNQKEELSECGESYTRIPIKNTQLWNVKYNDTMSSVHKDIPMTLYTAIQKNIRPCLISTGRPNPGYTHILGLKGNIGLMNFHALDFEHSGPISVKVSNTGIVGKNNQTYLQCLLGKDDIMRVNSDLAFVVLRGLAFRDITQHFSDISFDFPSYQGVVNREEVMVYTNNFPVVFDNPHGNDVPHPRTLCYNFPNHFTGMCGVPIVVLKDNGSSIVGIHAGGSDDGRGYGIEVTPQDIEKGISFFTKDQNFVLCSEGKISVQSFLDPSPKSVFRYEQLQNLTYYGRTGSEVNINQKSRLRKSLFDGMVEPLLKQYLNYEQKIWYGKPQLVPLGAGENYRSPYNVAMRKMSFQNIALDPKVLEKVYEVMSRRFIDGLREKDVPILRPLTVEVAVNGHRQDCYLKRINVKTAAGFGYDAQKSLFLPIVDEDEVRLIREPTEHLKEQINLLLTELEGGSFNRVIFNAKLKDEPRPLEKVQNAETRVYYASPIDSLILNKMYLGPFYTLMTQFNDLFCCTVGINMLSDVTELVDYFKWKDNILAGDYSRFDISVPYDISYTTSRVIYRVLRECGYNEYSLNVVQGLLSSNLHPTIQLLTDVFDAPGLQPSGKSYTTEDNCLKNLAIMMYIWYSDPELEDKDFFEYNRPKTNGDDLLNSVNPSVGYLYNNITFSEACNNLLGVKFTTPDKQGEHVEFLSLTETTYLKRSFVFDQKLGKWKAPISLDTLNKMLIWYIPSSSIPVTTQMQATFVSFLWELSLHCEKQTFDDISKKLHQILCKGYFMGRWVNYPSYDEIINTIFYTEEYLEVEQRSLSMTIEGEEGVDATLPPLKVYVGTTHSCEKTASHLEYIKSN